MDIKFTRNNRSNVFKCVVEFMHGDADATTYEYFYYNDKESAEKAHKFLESWDWYDNGYKTPAYSYEFEDECLRYGVTNWDRDLYDKDYLAKLVNIKWYYYNNYGEEYFVEWIKND